MGSVCSAKKYSPKSNKKSKHITIAPKRSIIHHQMEKPNLLWETIRYFPHILFNIEPINTGFRRSLFHDLSHFHYFLESEFGFTDVRDSDFMYCKSLLNLNMLILDCYFT